MTTRLIGRAGWRLVEAGWKRGPATLEHGPALVSFTDFTFARWRDLPGAWLAAARLRRRWPTRQGAVGLMLWAQPWRRRSGSISIWLGEAELRRFIGSSEHVKIMRRHRQRMSGSAATWQAHPFVRADAVGEARRRLAARG